MKGRTIPIQLKEGIKLPYKESTSHHANLKPTCRCRCRNSPNLHLGSDRWLASDRYWAITGMAVDLQRVVSSHPFADDFSGGCRILARYHMPTYHLGRLAASPIGAERNGRHFCWAYDARLAFLQRSIVDFYSQLFTVRRDRASNHPADPSTMAPVRYAAN